MVKYSIEGSTLESKDKKLLRTVCRKVALTTKPCNRVCDSGLLEDPNAPKGFEKKPADDSLRLNELEHPNYTRLGGAEFEYNPVLSGDELQQVLSKVEVRKALDGGNYNAAPSTMSGGAALQVEDRSLHLGRLRNQAKAAIRDWDRKTPIRQVLKTKLPEASDDFIERFANLVDNYRLKLEKKEAAEPRVAGSRKPGTRGHQGPSFKQWAASGKATSEQATIRGKPVNPNPDIRSPFFDEKTGTLHTSKGSFPMYIPSRDKDDPEAATKFHNILNDKKVNEFHDYAMENWSKAHRLLKEGKLPEEVVMHSVLFSQLSPNTPVPVQELMYGHLVDSMKHTGLDPRTAEFANIRQDWLGRDNPSVFPEHGRSYFEHLQDQLRLKNDSLQTSRKAGDISSFMLAPNKFKNMAKYHSLHKGLVDIVNRHRTDARSAIQELMDHKHKAQLWKAKRKRDIDRGLPDPGEYQGPDVPGLAPKTARYVYGMMGGGNVIVPDTHMSRYLFGLEKGKDNPTIKYIKDLLWNPNNSEVLNGIDRYYAKNHDAVKHLREHPRWKGEFDSDEDAVFPAFWKNWVAIVPHERARGLGTSGRNISEDESDYGWVTDHRPFWEAIAPHLAKAEDEVPDTALPWQTAKTMHEWVMLYGEHPAMMMYYRYLFPKLLAHHERKKKENPTIKFEALAIELRKALGDQNIFDRYGLRTPPELRQKLAAQGGHARFDPNAFGRQHGLKTPRVLREGPSPPQPGIGVVDSQRDSVGDYNQRPEQHALVHGLDFGKKVRGAPTVDPYNARAEFSHWRKAPNKSWVFVKQEPVWPTKPRQPWMSESRREGLFHNLAHNFFGLGKYVPTVSVIHHPETGNEAAVIERIKGEHYTGRDEHRQTIRALGDSGELDKLMIQDFVMAMPDRHDHNYMMVPGGMKVLDHGLILHQNPGDFPDYLNEYGNEKSREDPNNWPGVENSEIHPEARAWLRGLDPDKLRHEMLRHEVPQGIIDDAVRRLALAKELNENEEYLEREQLWDAPSGITGKHRKFVIR